MSKPSKPNRMSKANEASQANKVSDPSRASDPIQVERKKVMAELEKVEAKMDGDILRTEYLTEWCKLNSQIQSLDGLVHFEHGHEKCFCRNRMRDIILMLKNDDDDEGDDDAVVEQEEKNQNQTQPIQPRKRKRLNPNEEPKLVEFQFNMPATDPTFCAPWADADMFVVDGTNIHVHDPVHCTIKADAKEIFFPATIHCYDTRQNRVWVRIIKQMIADKRPAQALLQPSNVVDNLYVFVLLFKKDVKVSVKKK